MFGEIQDRRIWRYIHIVEYLMPGQNHLHDIFILFYGDRFLHDGLWLEHTNILCIIMVCCYFQFVCQPIQYGRDNMFNVEAIIYCLQYGVMFITFPGCLSFKNLIFMFWSTISGAMVSFRSQAKLSLNFFNLSPNQCISDTLKCIHMYFCVISRPFQYFFSCCSNCMKMVIY